MMFAGALICAVVCGFAINIGSAQNVKGNSLVVRTQKGQLRGSILKSMHNKSIYSFRGIRYAQPPTGERRFKPPVEVEPWRGVVDATKDGAICFQISGELQIPESEDCLFLNVYTTKLPNGRHNPKRPVVVFFHEGAFLFSAGHSVLRGPHYLADQDIVLVTLNYRLGALGFLSTGDDILPGNYGMKDQVAALRWVKQNIDVFGGDPDSVTIMGYSVGSHSVLLHMISPMSRGLFHRSIAMSGAMFQKWAVRRDAIRAAKKNAAKLNCPTDTSEQIYQCFMNFTAEEIARSIVGMAEWGYGPQPYSPVIEHGEDPFLTGDPTELYMKGEFAQVPVMLGVTKNELDWQSLQVLANDSWLNDANENFNHVYPITFMYGADTANPDYSTKALRKFYMNDQPLSNDTMMEFGRIYSDALVNFGITRAAELISSKSSKPVYYYCFAYEGRYSYIYKPGTTEPFGVVHHDDTIYLFYNADKFPFFRPDDPEYHEVDKITKLWANFIQTGNPTPKGDDLLDNVTWKPYTKQNLNYLHHGSQLQMKKGLFKERMDLWEKLFPLPQIKTNNVKN